MTEQYAEDCDHDAWECYGGYHRCGYACGFNWLAGLRPGDEACDVCHPKEDPQQFVTKDSGKREEYPSGMVRDTQEGKARFDLLLPDGVPYGDQFLTRVAALLARGADKYNDRNWEKAEGFAELARFKASGLRHMMQWMAGETDEDHAAAVVFNLMAYETIKRKVVGEDSSS